MITPDRFEMIETISADALAKHPVWAHYESAGDREVLLGWGVAPAVADREIDRYAFCGPAPLFPVLALHPIPPLRHLLIGVTFELPAGRRCSGYLLTPHGYGLFVGGREFCLNRTLAGHSARVAAELATAVDSSVEELFPLRYESPLQASGGEAIRGAIERFW